MKFRHKKLTGLFTAGALIITMSVQTGAAVSGISAGISEKIAESMENSTDVNAGISSALASCIDVSMAKASISSGENAVTSSGRQDTVSGRRGGTRRKASKGCRM